MLTPFIETPVQWFHSLHVALFETCVLPVVRFLDLSAFSEEAFDGTELFLLGVLQIALLYAVLRPIEKLRPAEVHELAYERRTDVVYTVLHRLGGFALLSFFLLTPILDNIEADLRLLGMTRLHLDELPWLTTSSLLLFFSYTLVIDFVGYWVHRAQHRYTLWWQLHALHHADRSLSLWSDNRNHVLDDLLIHIVMAMVAWFIGVEPAQFLLLTLLSSALQSFQHANIRIGFGRVGERLLVSPSFHRVHHGISSGNEGTAMGCNFGVLFPYWDILFKTAKFNAPLEPTGVQDQISQFGAPRQYGLGFWQQQHLGVLRLLGKA